MENHLDLIEWFNKMGYEGLIPESLVNICNKSTFYIWNELIQNTKPKQQVVDIRNNIIINRLRSKPLNKQDEFPHPVKNIVQYLKRETLEKRLDNLRTTVEEKKNRVNNQSRNNKMKYLTIEIIKSKIKENEEREFLLDKKCQFLERDIQEAEEALTYTKTLTPVELDEDQNVAEITETLQKCAEKLEKLLKKIHNNDQKSFRFYSAQKQPKTETTYKRYLMSERKLSEKDEFINYGGNSVRRIKNSKENVERNRKVNKNLFAHTNEPNRNRENKRESLGILSNSFLNQNELDILTETDAFEEFPLKMCSTTKAISIIPSAKFHFDSNCTLQLNKYHQISNSFIFNELNKDEFVTKKLRNLLYSHNRQIIWKTFRTHNDNLCLAVTKNIILENESNEKSTVNQEDVMKVYFIHIHTELQTLKLKAVLNDTLNKVAEKKKFVYVTLGNSRLSPEAIEQVGKQFKSQLDNICLDVALAEMKKEINFIKNSDGDNDLHISLEKIIQTKENIIKKIESIKQFISNIYDTMQSIIRTNEMTNACVRKLGPFVEDLTWSSPLTQGLHCNEIRTFEKFPLEHNRRCIYTNPAKSYRDIALDVPASVDIDSDTLYMLSELLESPFSPPETVVLHIIKSKIKLNALKSLPSHSIKHTHKKYSLKELQAQESYLQYALDKLNSILFSTTANKTLSTVENIKNIMEIWQEMPLKDFISPERQLEGHDYKYYEKQFDNFYNC